MADIAATVRFQFPTPVVVFAFLEQRDLLVTCARPLCKLFFDVQLRSSDTPFGRNFRLASIGVYL